MLITQFSPDFEEGSLVEGVHIPRNTALHSLLGKGEQTACEYRTSQDVTLWPINISHAEYINSQEVSAYTKNSRLGFNAKSAISLKLEAIGGHNFDELAMDSLDLHIRGSESFPLHLFEAIFKGYQGVLYKENAKLWRDEEGKTEVLAKGYDQSEALLPYSNRQFDGFRLLKEYFLFSKRYLFLSLTNLNITFSKCHNDEIELLILLDHHDPRLDKLVSAENFALFCCPAINLFPKKADRISIKNEDHQFHVVPDRLRPLDFEVCSLTKIQGFSTGTEPTTEFLPLYSSPESRHSNKHKAYFTLAREERKLNEKQRKFGHRSSYIGSEIHVNLVDPKQAPYSENLRQLSVETMCSNRDLPLMMPIGKGKTDFTTETGVPCESVRCIGEPTRPLPAPAKGGLSWDLINQLSINFLGMIESDSDSALSGLKTLLSIMMDKNDYSQSKQIDGIIKVKIENITARLPFSGPQCFGRGVAINLTIDEPAFEGNSAFMLCMVLDQFFAQYVSINSFTQLVLASSDRGEIFRWPIRIGLRNPI